MTTSPNTFRAAVRKNEIERVRSMLAASDNPAGLAREGFSTASTAGHEELVDMLLAAGLDLAATNVLGQTVLFEVLDSKSTIKKLVQRGADVNARNARHSTPLHLAASNNSGSIPLLLELGAELDAQDDEGSTPLHIASGQSLKTSVSHLLKAGANPNAVSTSDTPLCQAVDGPQKSRLGVVQQLLKAGADVNLARPTSRMTPLLIAAARGAPVEVLQALLEAGADITAEHVGRNALQLAEEEGHRAQADYLRSKGLPEGPGISRVGQVGTPP